MASTPRTTSRARTTTRRTVNGTSSCARCRSASPKRGRASGGRAWSSSSTSARSANEQRHRHGCGEGHRSRNRGGVRPRGVVRRGRRSRHGSARADRGADRRDRGHAGRRRRRPRDERRGRESRRRSLRRAGRRRGQRRRDAGKAHRRQHAPRVRPALLDQREGAHVSRSGRPQGPGEDQGQPHRDRVQDRARRAARFAPVLRYEGRGDPARPRARARLGARGYPRERGLPGDRRHADAEGILRRDARPGRVPPRERAGATAGTPRDPGRDREGRGPYRRALQQRGHRRRGHDPRDLDGALGQGHGGERARRVPREQVRRAPHDREEARLDHQHVLDHRRDRARAARQLRGVEGRDPRAHPRHAGRLRAVRDPCERAAPRDDRHTVRREIPSGVVSEPRGRPQSDPEAPVNVGAREARRRRVRGALPGVRRVELRDGKRPLWRRRRPRGEVKPLDIATPALLRVQGEGRTFLALWRDQHLWDLNPLTLDALLRLPVDGIRAGLGAIIGPELDPAQVELAAPAESQEVWAAGVTYLRSREARIEETTQKTIYEHVYESDRPELFFKAAGWRVVPDGGEVGVREDSTWDVPEPELAVLSNAHGEIVAYACGNDMSSRSIEGENPLFLPQAKIYDRSCSIGPAAVLAWEVDPSESAITMRISRGGSRVFDGAASLSDMVRDPAELTAELQASYPLPAGAWLLTGTSLVPPPPYTAEPGDSVTIEIEGVGRLVNHIVSVPHSGARAQPRLQRDSHVMRGG